MVEPDCVLNAGGPGGCVEGEFGSTSSLRNWRQLEEVSRDDKLDATEWTGVVSDLASDRLKLVKQVAVDHGDFINDQYFGTHPAMLRLLIPLDLLD